jgi:hypothetical protein
MRDATSRLTREELVELLRLEPVRTTLNACIRAAWRRGYLANPKHHKDPATTPKAPHLTEWPQLLADQGPKALQDAFLKGYEHGM